MGLRPHVVIVGAGFGGLWAAKTFAGKPVDVTLVDRNNYHSFFPLLYQVAAAELQPGDIAYPVRAITRRMANVEFLLGEASSVDFQANTVTVGDETIRYDYLILAPGSTTQHFGVPGAGEHTWPLRTLDQGIALRNHTLWVLERSLRFTGAARRAARTFVVVGGGPTGVEYSGALAELIAGPLRRDMGSLEDVSVIMLEAAPHVLGVYPESLRRYAEARLRKKGVDVRLGAQVAAVKQSAVLLADGGSIEADTIVWTAGVGGPPDLAAWGLPTARNGSVDVRSDLRPASLDRVFIVGDAARPDGDTAPMVAQNAQQQGVLAARNVVAHLEGNPLEPYRYRDLGNMAVIGRNAAVVHLFRRWKFKGFVAWAMWLALHLMKLVGFRNRVAALLSWSGDYFFSDRVARLIVPSGFGTGPRRPER